MVCMGIVAYPYFECHINRHHYPRIWKQIGFHLLSGRNQCISGIVWRAAHHCIGIRLGDPFSNFYRYFKSMATLDLPIGSAGYFHRSDGACQWMYRALFHKQHKSPFFNMLRNSLLRGRMCHHADHVSDTRSTHSKLPIRKMQANSLQSDLEHCISVATVDPGCSAAYRYLFTAKMQK